MTSKTLMPDPSKDQHMMNEATAEKIVAAGSVSRKDVVLEIGAGSGVLTQKLARKGARIIAIEMDRRFSKTLGRLEAANVEIIYANALGIMDKIQFNKLVSNIPYSICEALVNKLMRRAFELAIISVPENFYSIISAKPGEKKYSLLSLKFQSFFSAELLFEIPAEAFSPPPKTKSCAVSITPLSEEDYARSPEKFVLRELFLQRTRKLKNALMESLINADKRLMTKRSTKKTAIARIAKMRLGKLLQKQVDNMSLGDFEAVLRKLRVSSCTPRPRPV